METIEPTISAIKAARQLLARYLPVSRLVAAPSLRKSADGSSVYLKLDAELPTGSFKVRGALWALSAQVSRGEVREVVASSTGNHGAAVAYAARLLNIKCRIFLPAKANPVKRKRIADTGATVVEDGADIVVAWDMAADYAAKQGAFFLNDATDPDVPAGPGTIACEILEQLPSVGTIVVPMGDTALIRGMAAATRQLAPAVRVIGVQAETASAYYLSWKEGKAINTDTCDTIADGLATRRAVPDNVRAIRSLLADVRLVSDAALLRAIKRLIIDEHVVAEPAGAASTAAWTEMPAPEGRSDVALLVSGANITVDTLKKALDT